MQAVIDRIEDEIAVILIEEKQLEWKTDAGNLPIGSEAGTWLIIQETADSWEIISIDEAATSEANAAAKQVQQKLQQKKKRSKFKRR